MSTNTIDLGGQVAIVTGAGGGIGRAIALALANHGASVVAVDVAEDPAQETARLVAAAGQRSLAIRADVTSESDVEQMVQRTITEFGQIDLLYNNAGITTLQSIEHLSADMWDRVFAVNCKGVFLGSKAVIPHMTERGTGRIINTASQAGKGAIPLQTHYCASKAAVIGFTRSLAIELKDTGIRVNSICPGSVLSEMTYREAAEAEELLGVPAAESLREWESNVPLGRWVTPEDVAKTAVFLASDYAEFMTGQAVNITGGETLN
ncbi:SDR family NAD(P)-dependent oxidoreductase [Leucobacter musarum]|uniref:SDR family NAD(P)-dependent oxidoreductase n=1 Tax=Leucobacter musarum TaxID=1930747 RepID=UPI0006A79FC3|nr:SDR family NAD(P)-dependent oxidoreductase [Leucobacter musarum]